MLLRGIKIFSLNPHHPHNRIVLTCTSMVRYMGVTTKSFVLGSFIDMSHYSSVFVVGAEISLFQGLAYIYSRTNNGNSVEMSHVAKILICSQ